MEAITDSSFQFGGRWFKFDDDLVTPADRREAVELCYGSGYTKGNMPQSGDYSSAYMLVYIRETEAPQVGPRSFDYLIPPPLIISYPNFFFAIIGNASDGDSNRIV
jgi:hypothetical protein